MMESSGAPLSVQVEAVLAGGGVLHRGDAAFRERPQQLAMAMAVAQAITDNATLAVEAGTGVGKTYAYLVPLLLSGRKGIVSTATKGLQDQLFTRDLPRLVERLGLPLKIAMLKGRANYLCRHRLARARQELETVDRWTLRQLASVESWASATSTGDLSEVAGLDERSTLTPLITSTKDNCLGSECPSFQACHVVAARREALAADVVVVNHHLFFADLALREGGLGELLPQVEVVVFDEAHQLLEAGLQFAATQVSSSGLRDLARDVRRLGLLLARGLADWVELSGQLDLGVMGLIAAATGTSDPVSGSAARGAAGRVRWSDRVSGRPDAAARPIEVAFADALQALSAGLARAQEACAVLADAHPDLGRLADRADEWRERLNRFMHPCEDDRVRWIDVSSDHVRLVDTPLDIRGVMAEARALGNKAWICTSATLGDEPTLEWFRQQSGLEDARTVLIGSPFDYATQAALWVPAHLPEPADASHPEAVGRLAARCAQRLGGRTFVLVTTLRVLPRIGAALRDHLRERGADLEVLVQGEQPKRALLERFLQAGEGRGAVLVGAHSFWEGIDVPGAALECVLIDKLPFPPPDDPLLEARSRQLRAAGKDPFRAIFLTETAIALKQGVGRLIRSESDRGLVVICDTRLAAKSYGRRLLEALPPARRLSTGQAVAEWLDVVRPEGELQTEGRAPR